MSKKVRFPPLAPLFGHKNKESNEIQRTTSDITASREDLKHRKLTKHNSEFLFVLPKASEREPAKRTISLDALTLDKFSKDPATKNERGERERVGEEREFGMQQVGSYYSTLGSRHISPTKSPTNKSPTNKSPTNKSPTNKKGSGGFLPPEPLELDPLTRVPSLGSRYGTDISSVSFKGNLHSDPVRRTKSYNRRSPTSPLAPITPVSSNLSLSPPAEFSKTADVAKRKAVVGGLAEWEQIPVDSLALLEDLNARTYEQTKKPLPQKTVSYDEIFRAIQTKEELTRKYNLSLESETKLEEELKGVKEKIADLSHKLSIAESEWQSSLETVAKSDARKYRLSNTRQQSIEEADQKEKNLQEKSEAERELDELSSEVSTMHVIKKAIQLKLFQASEEKNSFIQSRKAQEELVENEKSALAKKIAEFGSSNARLEEMMERAKVRMDQQITAEKALEEQLSKAKDQVINLIDQIGQKEAHEARELRAQKVAKEAEARAKHKHPTGTVTLVFTDVQGSTAQWELHPDVMSVALEQHNTILRAKLQLTGGYEVRTEGDSFMVAFHTPLSAVWWCIFVQQALLEAEWPARLVNSSNSAEEYAEDGTLLFRGMRVRMGAHVGKAQTQVDALTGRMDYFGPMVNRAAKISGMGRGGQILLSGSVWNAVRADMGNTVVATHAGEIKLKGMETEEEIIQILPLSLAKRKFPPLKGRRLRRDYKNLA